MGNQNSKSPSNLYDVGYGRPPKKSQFKPGGSGNPSGARRQASSLAPDLKALLERALNEKTKLRQDEHEITKAAAGIDLLVNQFAEGDRHARRDLMSLADKLGVDLTAGQRERIEGAFTQVLSAEDQALLDDYVRRHADRPHHSEPKRALHLHQSECPQPPLETQGDTHDQKRSS